MPLWSKSPLFLAILPILPSGDVGYDYPDSDVVEALSVADSVALSAVMLFARELNNADLETAAREQLKRAASFAFAEWVDPTDIPTSTAETQT